MRDFSAQPRLVLIRVKVERAKKHLIDFEVAAADFRDAYKRVIGTDTDPKTLQAQRYFARLPINRFEVLSIAGDVIPRTCVASWTISPSIWLRLDNAGG